MSPRRENRVFLVLDTETTGLSSTDRIVSICWALHDDRGDELSSTHHIVRPDGFTIPTSAVRVHHITTERARREGIPLAEALRQLHAAIGEFRPAMYIGHNVAFDRPIVLNEYALARLPENLSRLPVF